MLYFSKLKLVIIYSIILFLSFFSIINFIDVNNNLILSKKVNLGLDLQGGSYLLLEVDTDPVIEQKLQNKLILLRKHLKDKKIKYKNLKIVNKAINFRISEDETKIFENFFLDKENFFNLYFTQYKSYEMEHTIQKNLVEIKYSRVVNPSLKLDFIGKSIIFPLVLVPLVAIE